MSRLCRTAVLLCFLFCISASAVALLIEMPRDRRRHVVGGCVHESCRRRGRFRRGILGGGGNLRHGGLQRDRDRRRRDLRRFPGNETDRGQRDSTNHVTILDGGGSNRVLQKTTAGVAILDAGNLRGQRALDGHLQRPAAVFDVTGRSARGLTGTRHAGFLEDDIQNSIDSSDQSNDETLLRNVKAAGRAGERTLTPRVSSGGRRHPTPGLGLGRRWRTDQLHRFVCEGNNHKQSPGFWDASVPEVWRSDKRLMAFRQRVLSFDPARANTGWLDVLVAQGAARCGVKLKDQALLRWATAWADHHLAVPIGEKRDSHLGMLDRRHAIPWHLSQLPIAATGVRPWR